MIKNIYDRKNHNDRQKQHEGIKGYFGGKALLIQLLLLLRTEQSPAQLVRKIHGY
ncbi:hypothetical protein D3C77_705450 [compost metagenome]